jgi:hypothetical protein
MDAISKFSKGSLISVTNGDPMKMGLALMNAKAVAICDISGSMAAKDSGENENSVRADVLQEVLDDLQDKYPGELVIYGFNSENIGILPSGILPPPDGTTPTHLALNNIYRKAADLEQEVILLSDGLPDQAEPCYDIAEEVGWPINTFYVGPYGERGGRDFMERLAEISGGVHNSVSLNTPLRLATEMEKLLLGA